MRRTPAARGRLPGEERRTLRSDLLLIWPSNGDRYVEYRDIFEVDGLPVRDRKERLTALFERPTPQTKNQLRAIINESARYNAGIITRNINTPMLALSFLEPKMQPRFRFRVARERRPQEPPASLPSLPPPTPSAPPPAPPLPPTPSNSNSIFRVTTEMWVVEFRETRRPTVIRTTRGRDFPARGRFWIDPATGAVLMSELEMRSAEMDATITVSYQSEPVLGFFVPIAMQEQYRGRTEHVDAVARYGRFRPIDTTRFDR